MFKIASCIFVAVCINFQQVVVAASFPNSLGLLGSFEPLRPLGSLLDNVKNEIQDKVTDVQDKVQDKVQDTMTDVKNTITDVKDTITDVKDKISDVQSKISGKLPDILRSILENGNEAIQKIGSGAINVSESLNSRLSAEVQRLKDKSEKFLQEAQNADISSCSRLYNKGRAALAELMSMFESCLLNETQKVGGTIQDLINVIIELQQNLPEKLQNVKQCIQGTSGISSCITQGLQSVMKLGITAKDAVRAAFQLYTFYPNMMMCCELTLVQFVPKHIIGLLADGGMCVQSTVKGMIPLTIH